MPNIFQAAQKSKNLHFRCNAVICRIEKRNSDSDFRTFGLEIHDSQQNLIPTNRGVKSFAYSCKYCFSSTII